MEGASGWAGRVLSIDRNTTADDDVEALRWTVFRNGIDSRAFEKNDFFRKLSTVIRYLCL